MPIKRKRSSDWIFKKSKKSKTQVHAVKGSLYKCNDIDRLKAKGWKTPIIRKLETHILSHKADFQKRNITRNRESPFIKNT